MSFEVRNLLESQRAIFAFEWSIPDASMCSHVVQKFTERIMKVVATLMSALENFLNSHTSPLALERSEKYMHQIFVASRQFIRFFEEAELFHPLRLHKKDVSVEIG